MHFDCVIIGGGPAGLTAATYLGRFQRGALVVDAGHSRARIIPKTRNYPGFADGISGGDLLGVLRAQALKHGAQIASATVSALARDGEHFIVVVDGRRIAASRILLATGLKDITPDMPGLRDAVAHASVRYCPVCDAYEATDDAIAVYGLIANAEGKARFLRSYSRAVTLLPLDVEADAAAAARLAQAGIALAPSPPADFRPTQSGIEVKLCNGDHMRFDVLYPVLGCEVRSDLASALGARCNDVGCLEVDAKQQTSIEGIYAAGDVVSDLHQLSVAAGHAGIAATAIHGSLPENFR
jgi:thioredoxin reductase (NADPH)